MTAFEKNKTVYKQDGTEYIYDHTVGEYAFVHPIVIVQTTSYYGDDYEEHEDVASHLVRIKESELSPHPWIAKINADTQKALDEQNAKLDEVKSQIGDAAISLQEMKRELSDFEKAAKTRPDLTLVLDFVMGRVTHCVTGSEYSGYKVITLEEALESRAQYDSGLKLVTFYGDQKKATARLNQYSDGSGGNYEIYPFKSEKEALAFIENMKAERGRILEASTDEKERNNALSFLERQGGDLPEVAIKLIEDRLQKQKENAVKTAQESLDKALAMSVTVND